MTEWNSAHIAEDCYAVFIEAHEVFFQTDSFIADCIKSGRGWNGGEVVYLLDDVRSVRKDFFCDGATGGIDGVVYVHLSNNVFLRKVMVFTNNELNVQKSNSVEFRYKAYSVLQCPTFRVILQEPMLNELFFFQVS